MALPRAKLVCEFENQFCISVQSAHVHLKRPSNLWSPRPGTVRWWKVMAEKQTATRCPFCPSCWLRPESVPSSSGLISNSLAFIFSQCCLLWHPDAGLLSHTTASLCPESLLPRDRKVSNIVNKSPADCLKRFGIYGSLIHGPLVHLWLSAITRLLPGTTPFLVLVKVVTDQVPFS